MYALYLIRNLVAYSFIFNLIKVFGIFSVKPDKARLMQYYYQHYFFPQCWLLCALKNKYINFRSTKEKTSLCMNFSKRRRKKYNLNRHFNHIFELVVASFGSCSSIRKFLSNLDLTLPCFLNSSQNNSLQTLIILLKDHIRNCQHNIQWPFDKEVANGIKATGTVDEW